MDGARFPASPHVLFHGVARTIAAVLDCEDQWPTSHAGRVAILARRLTRLAGRPEDALVYYAGLVHDIGGSGLDEHITSYAERAFPDDSSQAHPRIGSQLLANCAAFAPVKLLVERHHERVDGHGFPFGASGAEIPLGASILHLADALELRLRMAPPDGRLAAVRAALRELAGTAIPTSLIGPAEAMLADDPGGIDALFDQHASTGLHADPVPGYPGLDHLEPIELVTTLLMLLARVVDSRSHHMVGHSLRVASLAFHIAAAVGAAVVDPWQAAWAGLIHNLGTATLSRRRLMDDAALVPGSHEMLRAQSYARDAVAAIPGLDHLTTAAFTYHERYDGSGGPHGLAGEHIPLLGRILAFADHYDRYTRERGRRTHADVMASLRDQLGRALDPHLADPALAVLDRVGPVVDQRQPEASWRRHFDGAHPAGPAQPRLAPRPTSPQRGALLLPLEPWQTVRLDPGREIVAGVDQLARACGTAPVADVTEHFGPDSCEALTAMLATPPEAPSTRYLFTPAGRPLEVIALSDRGSAGIRLLVRSAVNQLQSLDRMALFYRNFLASSEAVVFTDPRGYIVDVNRAFLDMFGFTLREVIGQHTRLLKSGHQTENTYRAMWQAISDPAVGSWNGELIDRRKDGREIHVQLRINAVRDASGSCIGYIAHHQDISQRKHAEAEILRRDLELQDKNRELERLSQFKSDMVAVTSHDLKSPLAAIVGVATLLRDNLERIPREQATAHLGRIIDSAGRMTSFIDNLLDLERISAGSLRLYPVPIRIDLLLSELVGQAHDAAAGRHQVTLVSSTGPRTLVGDVTRLTQIVSNLLANAGKFTAPGSTVTVTLTDGPDQWSRIEVADQGPGIPPAQLGAVFDRYYQVEGTGGASQRAFGSGLGLSIVRSLVELHDGRVWAENRPAGGCRFVVEVPCGRADRSLALVLARQCGAVVEVVEGLNRQGTLVRRVDTLAELRSMARVTVASLIVVASSLLDRETRSYLTGLADQAGRPCLARLEEEVGDVRLSAPFDAVLAAPVFSDELRALVGARPVPGGAA